MSKDFQFRKGEEETNRSQRFGEGLGRVQLLNDDEGRSIMEFGRVYSWVVA